MKNKIYSLLFVLTGVSCFTSVKAQLITNNTQTPAQLVQNVLLGTGVTVSNITFNGSATAIGFFNGVNTNLGLDSGIVMTTGTVLSPNGPHGPNNSGSSGVDNNFPGDPDLTVIAGIQTFNAAVLEFDFVPQSDTVKFRYVFGSEEYMEFVNSGVNDAFGFFISGPGIAGPFTNSAENIALIPGTTTPVTIDNVNANLNSQYWFNNEIPPGATIQYDGFTTVLTAQSPVTCGQTYHLKIAIADAGDGIYDSGVFLEAGSLTSNSVSLATITASGDSTFVEGCSCAQFHFTRPGLAQDTLVVDFTIGGAAINGTDYPTIPDSVIFLPGQSTVSVNVCPFADGLVEGPESVTITVQQLTLCGTTTINAVLYILDQPLPLSNNMNDTTLTCNILSPVTFTANLTGGYPPFYYAWSTGDSTNSITVNPTTTTTYSLIVTDTCGSVDTTVVTVYISGLTITADSTNATCGAADGSITVNQTGGIAPIQYSLDTGATYQGSNVFTNLFPGVYTVIAQDNSGCSDTLTIIVNNLGGPIIDSTIVINPPCNGICDGQSFVFATATQGGTLSYLWSDPLSQSNDTAFGLCPQVYYITVTETSGITCQTTVSVSLNEPPALIITSTADSASCANNDGTITASASGGTGSSYQYSIDGGTTYQSSNIFNGLPAGTYTVQVQDSNACVTASSSVAIFIAAGPNINITSTDVSCNGGTNGTINIGASGGAGNPYQYSTDGGVTYQAGNNFTGLSAGTYLILVQDSLGCTTQDSVTITSPPALSLGIDSTRVSCYGGNNGGATATLTGGTSPYNYQWASGQTTSSIAGLAAGTYYVAVTDALGCITGDSIIVTQPDSLLLSMGSTVAVCGYNDGTAAVNASGGTPLPNNSYAYSWTPGSQTTATAYGLPTGMYMVTVTDANNCTKQDSVFVPWILGVEAQFTPSPENGESPLTVNFSNGSVGASSYFWTFGDGTTDSIMNPSHIYAGHGQFEVVLTACYTPNCCDTATYRIDVLDTLLVPNVFSPNGDGLNDVFRILNRDLVKIEVVIFNRWGSKMFTYTDVNGGWNGKKEGGSDCPDGTYFYIVNYAERSDGKIYPVQKGHVTLVR